MHFGDEVCRHYLGKSYKQLSEHLPGLLLTDTHPKEVNDDSMRLLIPLGKIKKRDFKTVDRFFDLLASFTRGELEEFPRVLIAADGATQKIGEYIGIDRLAIPLTPIAINVDKFLEKAMEWLSKKQTDSASRSALVKKIKKHQGI